jgi:hypothetical protein
LGCVSGCRARLGGSAPWSANLLRLSRDAKRWGVAAGFEEYCECEIHWQVGRMYLHFGPWPDLLGTTLASRTN